MGLKKYIKERPPVTEKWRFVKDTMNTHLMGTPPEHLFKARRPLESTNEYALVYRVDNFQPITKQAFSTAVGSIISTADHIYIEENNVNDNTQAFVDDVVIKIAGKNFDFKDYVVKYIGYMVEADPNSCLVAIPKHPHEELIPDWREDLPNFDNIQNEFIDISIELISSDRIQRVSDEELIFDAGMWLYKIEEKQEFWEPYYYILNAEETSLCIPVKTIDGFDYEIVPFYANNLEDPPFDVIGNNPILEEVDGQMVEYHESTYSGGVAIANEVVSVKSDEQICTTRFTYPEKFLQMERCAHPGCIECRNPNSPYAGLYVNYDETGDCTTCDTCSGTGKVAPDTSPLGTHFIAKSDVFDQEGRFVPPIHFITPPLESPKYLDDKWRADYVLMEQALFIMSQNMTNQSGESKSYDVAQKVAVISGAVRNIYGIYEKSLNTIQQFLNGTPDIEIILPPDFNVKTSQDITIELGEAKNTSSVYTSELTRELLLKKFGNTTENRKAVDFLELKDKLWGMTTDEIVKLKAIYGKDLVVRDQVIHDKGLAIMKQLSVMDGFETWSTEKLNTEFDKMVDVIMDIKPEEAEILDDPLAQLEAEAKSKLKGTVGGVQGIIAINAAVAIGDMTEASAEVLLVEIYGLSPEIAGKLIEKGGTPPKDVIEAITP